MNCYPHPFSGLIPCLLGNGLCFYPQLIFFFYFKKKNNFIEIKMCCFFFLFFFLENHQVVKELNPDYAQHFVRTDLDPNCLERLSAGDTNKS